MEKIVIVVGFGEVGKALMKSDKSKHQTFGVDINLPASFASVARDGGSIRVQPATDPTAADLSPLTVRIYNGGASKHNLRHSRSATFEDFTIDKSDQVLIAA
jgi:hypothetical protein